MSTGNALIGKRSFFINKNFLLLWIGGTISRLGQVLLFEGFGLWITFGIVKNQAGATSAVKFSEVCAFLALLTLGVFAGVFVDRWGNKKRILMVTAAGRAVACFVPIVAALLLQFTPNPPLWMIAFALASIYISGFGVSALTHFAIPASYVIFDDCIEERDYAYANGLLLTATFASILVGTFVATLAFSLFGIYGIIVLCTLLYMASFVVSSNLDVRVHTQTVPRKGVFREWWDSIILCFKIPLLSMLLLALVLINIWNGALLMLASTFITHNLHTAFQLAPVYDSNNAFYGVLGIFIEIGFISGALLFGLFARRIGERRVFSYGLLAAGLLMVAVSRFTQYTPAIVVIVLISIATAGVNVIAVPIYLWVTPRHILGRIRSIVDVTTNLVSLVTGVICLALLGSSLQSFHAQLYRTTFTFTDTVFAIVGILCITGGIVIIRYLHGVRKDEFEVTNTVSEARAVSDTSVNTLQKGEESTYSANIEKIQRPVK